ncbi:MAG: LysR family transcriptional regulator [Geminicoccaceae bacterium]
MIDPVLDWDRLRIFHAVAEAGSFTRAAERLNISQSAVSRQMGALEEDLGTVLFHRHARGLVLTEQGEILRQTARDLATQVRDAENRLSESREEPAGHLRINTTVGFGAIWLTPHLSAFVERHPDISITLLVQDSEADLSMREADVAIRLQPPTQADLVQRKLMTVHTHLYASPHYLETMGAPKDVASLDQHRLIVYGTETAPPAPSLNWPVHAGQGEDVAPRKAHFTVNNVIAMMTAVEAGLGIATLPDYLTHRSNKLVRVLSDVEGPSFMAFFVYPEELRNSKRLAVFREFLLEKVEEEGSW